MAVPKSMQTRVGIWIEIPSLLFQFSSLGQFSRNDYSTLSQDGKYVWLLCLLVHNSLSLLRNRLWYRLYNEDYISTVRAWL